MSRDETRADIRRALIKRGPAASADIADATPYRQATVREHLLAMRRAGTVECRPNPMDPRQQLYEWAPEEAPEVPA